MAAKILDGKAMAEQIRGEVAGEAAEFTAKTGVTPCLAAVLVGDNPASQVYVRNKQKACEKAGMKSNLHRLRPTRPSEQLLDLIDRLNHDPAVHGILVQLPLPKQIDETRVLEAVNPLKDVDAFHPENVGRIVQGRPRFLPCTPHGVQQLLLRHNIPIAGAHVVVVGRSDIVGKPMAIMLMQRGPGGDATVTVCHSRTEEPAGDSAAGRHPDRGHRPGEVRHGRHGQARRGGDRRGHQPHGRRAWWATSISRRSRRWPARSRPCPAASAR